MNGLTRLEPKWNPFRDMEELQNRLFSLLHPYPARGVTEKEESMTVAEWSPLVDITEDDKEYVIKAELPEVKKENVKVTVEEGVLTLAGDRKFEKEEKGRRYHRVERSYGSFTRCFTLPDDADAAKVNAEFKDGVLNVRLAKLEKAKPKAIEVKVA